MTCSRAYDSYDTIIDSVFGQPDDTAVRQVKATFRKAPLVGIIASEERSWLTSVFRSPAGTADRTHHTHLTQLVLPLLGRLNRRYDT